MRDERSAASGGDDSIETGRSYGEVGPALGRLYEARHVPTGQVAVRFVLGANVEWQPEGGWRVRLSFGPRSPSVTAVVERAPASARVTELADAFVQMTAALTRAEDNAALQDHFSQGPLRPWGRWAVNTLGGLAALALGLGVWLHVPRESKHVAEVPGIEIESWSTDGSQVDPAVPKTDKPPRPVKNPKHAPCTQGLELEVWGICWISVTQRPCPAQTLAHEEKCLLPVAALKPAPSSVDAGAPGKQ